MPYQSLQFCDVEMHNNLNTEEIIIIIIIIIIIVIMLKLYAHIFV